MIFFSSKVQDSGDVITEGRIRVIFSIPCEPNLDALIQNQHVSTVVCIVAFRIDNLKILGNFCHLL